MKTDDIEKMFQNLDFDTAEPSEDHELKFLKKLEKNNGGKRKGKIIYMNIFVPVASIAASFLVAFMLFGGMLNNTAKAGELASVSPEMKETQDFYTSVIQTELSRLKSEKTPETEAVINDALKQLDILEKNHEKLKKDLVASGNDKRVIYAMINNYQQRIQLLQEVLQKTDEINQFKNTKNEHNIL